MPKYSDKYFDKDYEYRYVILSRSLADKIIEIRDTGSYLSEDDSRAFGIIQSKGWVHYDYHLPEPHILLFRRPIGTNPRTGKVEEDLKQKFFSEQQKKFMACAKVV